MQAVLALDVLTVWKAGHLYRLSTDCVIVSALHAGGLKQSRVTLYTRVSIQLHCRPGKLVSTTS